MRLERPRVRCRHDRRPCAPDSLCSAKPPLPPQSPAAPSRFHAAISSECAAADLGHFPMQCRLQLANLAFRAFDHLSLPKQMATGNHTISLAGGTELPQTRRFNQLWKWYQWIIRALTAAAKKTANTTPKIRKMRNESSMRLTSCWSV